MNSGSEIGTLPHLWECEFLETGLCPFSTEASFPSERKQRSREVSGNRGTLCVLTPRTRDRLQTLWNLRSSLPFCKFSFPFLQLFLHLQGKEAGYYLSSWQLSTHRMTCSRSPTNGGGTPWSCQGNPPEGLSVRVTLPNTVTDECRYMLFWLSEWCGVDWLTDAFWITQVEPWKPVPHRILKSPCSSIPWSLPPAPPHCLSPNTGRIASHFCLLMN